MQQTHRSTSGESLQEQRNDIEAQTKQEVNPSQEKQQNMILTEDDGIIEFIGSQADYTEREFNFQQLVLESDEQQHKQQIIIIEKKKQDEGISTEYKTMLLEDQHNNPYLCSQILIDINNSDEENNTTSNKEQKKQQIFKTIQKSVSNLNQIVQSQIKVIAVIEKSQDNLQIDQNFTKQQKELKVQNSSSSQKKGQQQQLAIKSDDDNKIQKQLQVEKPMNQQKNGDDNEIIKAKEEKIQQIEVIINGKDNQKQEKQKIQQVGQKYKSQQVSQKQIQISKQINEKEQTQQTKYKQEAQEIKEVQERLKKQPNDTFLLQNNKSNQQIKARQNKSFLGMKLVLFVVLMIFSIKIIVILERNFSNGWLNMIKKNVKNVVFILFGTILFLLFLRQKLMNKKNKEKGYNSTNQVIFSCSQN